MKICKILIWVTCLCLIKLSVKGSAIPLFEKSNFINQFSSQCDRQRDSLALVALYEATDGENWFNTWDLSEPIEFWYGIELNDQGCVDIIELDGEVGGPNISSGSGGNNLIGELPDKIGDLKSLKRLLLCCNELSGTIPPRITELTELRDLYLNENQLVGEIPNTIGSMIKLEVLSLNNNRVEGTIPVSIGGLTNLVSLNLDNNQIGGSIPTTIGNLRKLLVILIQDNKLEGELPSTIGLLSSLRTLVLSNNMLSGRIPTSIGKDSPLFNTLDLSNNKFTGTLPSEFGDLDRLSTLNLSSNNINGPIPPEYGLLDRLVTLLLNDNNLSSCIPSELLKFCGIFEYSFSNNPLLPWSGDIQRFCDREPQVTAFCDDGNPLSSNDVIDVNCICGGYMEEVILFIDDAISACGVDQLVLSSEVVGDSYLWSTGATSQFLSVNSDGLYWLEVVRGGDRYRDTIDVKFQSDELDLGSDPSVCFGSEESVLASNIMADYYLWSTGSTMQNIQIETTGDYWIEATIGACRFKDTISVTVLGEALELGENRLLCNDQDSVAIKTNFNADSYLWSTGEITQEIAVASSGEFWVETTIESCISRDSILVEAVTDSLSITSIITDCLEQVYSLGSNIEADSYLWSSGEREKGIKASKSGQYWVEISLGGCMYRDTIDLIIRDGLDLSVPLDTTVCKGSELFANAVESGIRIVWSDGHPDGARSFLESGTYDYSISSADCSSSSSIIVEVIPCNENDCPIYIPNVISAQSEDINNRQFRFFSSCDMASFSVDVYDRWGNQVYQSTDQNASWMGWLGSNRLVRGVYIIQLTYQINSGQPSIIIQRTLSVI